MTTVNLDTRERISLWCGVILVLLVLALVVYIPMVPYKNYVGAKKNLSSRRTEIGTKQRLKAAAIEQLQSQEEFMDKLAARDPRFDLYAFIDRTVREIKLSERSTLKKTAMRRGTSDKQIGVDLEINSVGLKELIDLFHTVYASNNLIAVQSAEIAPGLYDKGLNCDVTFITVKGL